MPPEIAALIAKPHLLFLVLLAGAMIAMAIEQFTSAQRRKAWRERNWGRGRGWHRGPKSARRPWHPKHDPTPPRTFDAADQLRLVMGTDFSIKPLLNRSETRVFKELDRIITSRNPSWKVMAQVSLGEILSCEDDDAYGCINTKRVDLLLVDEECTPRHAIEYQGAGHHQGTAAARDAVKKEALRRAGIGYHEVVAGHTTPSELRRLIERLIGAP